MQTPDVTPVQKLVAAALTVLGAGLTLAMSFGVDLTTEQVTAIGGFAAAVGSAFVVADAVIRNGRSKIVANSEALLRLKQVRREEERPNEALIRD